MSATAGVTISTTVPDPSLSQPACSDTAEGCSQDSGRYDHGVSAYYFVFLAIILCAVGVAAFLMWRKKKRARRWGHSGRAAALANDLPPWGAARPRRRYWHGRSDTAEASPEEGLNEAGEAPPPYVPKSQEQEQALPEQTAAGSLAVPMQSLSRENAGLKPPDYTERHPQPTIGDAVASSGNSSHEHAERNGTQHL